MNTLSGKEFWQMPLLCMGNGMTLILALRR